MIRGLPYDCYRLFDEERPVTGVNAAQPELFGTKSSPRQQGRRVVIAALAVLLSVAAIAVAGMAFVQGSWWYAYGTDRALDRESRARVEAIRDEVGASGETNRIVVWLNAALAPNTHPSDVRAYLTAAQEMLEKMNDPELAQTATQLREIIETIRPTMKHPSSLEATSTPYSAPTLERPQ